VGMGCKVGGDGWLSWLGRVAQLGGMGDQVGGDWLLS
jgi:hypothetical protein